MSKAKRPLTLSAHAAKSESERSAVRDDVFAHLLRWTAGNLLLVPVWWMLSIAKYEGNEWLIGAWGLVTGVVWARILALLFIWLKLRPCRISK